MPLSPRILAAGLVLIAAPEEAQGVQDARREIARPAQDGAFGTPAPGIAAESRLDNGALPDTGVSRLAPPPSGDRETVRILGAALRTEPALGRVTATQDCGTVFRGTVCQGRPSSEISWKGATRANLILAERLDASRPAPEGASRRASVILARASRAGACAARQNSRSHPSCAGDLT